jgi:catechol 2,3-dioxygenase-like lactoylglutathione lyase family enzyme
MSATNLLSNITEAPVVDAVGHIEVNTSDLARFRAFYEGLLGLGHVITLKMAQPPHLRYAVFAVGSHTVLRVVEVPGYEPPLDANGADSGHRARIDHFSLLVGDESSLESMRDRLVAAGASEGDVSTLGPYLSVTFRDPDGMKGRISCRWPGFDPSRFEDELLECSIPQRTANHLSS